MSNSDETDAAYSEAIENCKCIAEQFEESEKKLAEVYGEYIMNRRQRKFPLTRAALIIMVLTILAVGISFMQRKVWLLWSTCVCIGAILGALAALLLIITAVIESRNRKGIRKRLIQTRRIAKRWKTALRKLERMGHRSGGASTAEYTMLTTDVNRCISSFRSRNARLRKYAFKDAEADEGEREPSGLQKILLVCAFLAGSLAAKIAGWFTRLFKGRKQ